MKTGQKILAIGLVVAIVAWFVITNTVLAGFTGTYHLHDNMDWNRITYKVTQGDADKFSAELAGPQKLKVKYKGEYDFKAEITFETASGETGRYELLIYKTLSQFEDEKNQIEMELNRIE